MRQYSHLQLISLVPSLNQRALYIDRDFPVLSREHFKTPVGVNNAKFNKTENTNRRPLMHIEIIDKQLQE